MSEQRFCFLKDDSGHTYLVPLEKVKFFNELMEKGECNWSEEWEDKWFNADFDDMRTSMHLSNYSFTDPQPIGA